MNIDFKVMTNDEVRMRIYSDTEVFDTIYLDLTLAKQVREDLDAALLEADDVGLWCNPEGLESEDIY